MRFSCDEIFFLSHFDLIRLSTLRILVASCYFVNSSRCYFCLQYFGPDSKNLDAKEQLVQSSGCLGRGEVSRKQFMKLRAKGLCYGLAGIDAEQTVPREVIVLLYYFR